MLSLRGRSKATVPQGSFSCLRQFTFWQSQGSSSQDCSCQEIATASSKPRNDKIGTAVLSLSLRGAKRLSPRGASLAFGNSPSGNLKEVLPRIAAATRLPRLLRSLAMTKLAVQRLACHCEERSDVAISGKCFPGCSCQEIATASLKPCNDSADWKFEATKRSCDF